MAPRVPDAYGDRALQPHELPPGGRVLLAADHRLSAALIEASLSEAGFEVDRVTPTSCLAALARGGAYDAVVIDLSVPVPAIVAVVGGICTHSRAPVIVTAPDEKVTCPEGVHAVVRHPHVQGELAAAVAAALQEPDTSLAA